MGTDKHRWSHQQKREGLIIAFVSTLALGFGLVVVRFLTQGEPLRDPPAVEQSPEPQPLSIEDDGGGATGAGEKAGQADSGQREPATEEQSTPG